MRLAKILAGAWIALSALPTPAQSSLPDAPPAKPVVYKVGNGVTPPKVVYAVDPEYYADARGLDDKAVEAVRQYRFKPGTLKGDPVAVSIQMEVSFQLF